MSPAGFGSSLFALLLLQAQAPQALPVRDMRYMRQLHLARAGASCATLDAAVFAHSSPSLKDLRLLSGGHEIPYGIAVNQSAQAGVEPAAVLNLVEHPRSVEFDLAMPARPYTQLELRLEGTDFVADASLTGKKDRSSAPGSPLGTFTVFDLSSRGLARNTTIAMQESAFPFLHVVLRGKGFRLRGAEVPPSREERTLFATVAETRDLTQQRDDTVARFHIPAHVPIEQAIVNIAPGFDGDFGRVVRVTATSEGCCGPREEVTGTILRVRRGTIQIERPSVPASLGANLQSDADVQVVVENGHLPILPIRSVALAMRQRTICFDAAAPTTLLYGDPTLTAPAARYQPHAQTSVATLGPELLNPAFRLSGSPRPWLRSHPVGLWTALLALVLGVGITFRLGKQRRAHSNML